MIITLINPPAPFALDPNMGEQLGLCYVAAALKSDGYKVQGIDFCAIDADYSKQDYLFHIDPCSDVYGIYCMSVQFKWVKEICKFIKKVNSKAKIFIGGPHASSSNPIDLLYIGADYVVKGYNEWAINNILSGIIKLPTENLIPDRSIFNKYEYKRTINGERAFHIVTSRGCPKACYYCDKTSVGRKVEYSPIDIVLEEIDILIEEHGARSFVIYDDIFTLKQQRLEIFCEEFKKRNLQWRCWARTDLVDKEILEMMKDSGLTSITFGVESGDETVLKRINKRATVYDNVKALRLCKELEIPVRCSLMFGNPGECKESLENTIHMIDICKPTEWNLAVLKPMPGSEFWNNPEKHGLKFDRQAIIDSDYEILNRFEDNGVGNIICSIDSCPDDELKELLPWFVSELERVSPRQKIQDTIQEIRI